MVLRVLYGLGALAAVNGLICTVYFAATCGWPAPWPAVIYFNGAALCVAIFLLCVNKIADAPEPNRPTSHLEGRG